MNKDQTEAQWKLLAARVKQQWGELTDDEVRKAEGNTEELIARIQEKYGDSREAIAEQFNKLKEEIES